MKKLLLTTLLLLIGLSSFAQIHMADSTVQVIAYWKKGETQNYLIRYHKLEISGNDTTRNVSSTCEVEINVLDSTENSYTTEWTYKNFKGSSESPLQNDIFNFSENMKVLVKTDEVGSFLEVLNWEDIRDAQREMIAVIKDKLKADPKRDEIMAAVLAKYSTKEAIETLSVPDVQSFLSFHGGSYKLGEIVDGELKVPSIYGNDLLDGNVTVSLEEIHEDDDYSILSVLQEVNKEQLIQNTLDFLASTAEISGQEPPTREDLKDLTHQITLWSNIHSSGWVLYSQQRKTIHAEGRTVIEERSMELL